MKRKQEEFQRMKKRFYDNKDPNSAIKYDEELEVIDTVDKNMHSPSKRVNKNSKEFQFAARVAEKLRQDSRKRTVFGDKNIAEEFLDAMKDPRYTAN